MAFSEANSTTFSQSGFSRLSSSFTGRYSFRDRLKVNELLAASGWWPGMPTCTEELLAYEPSVQLPNQLGATQREVYINIVCMPMYSLQSQEELRMRHYQEDQLSQFITVLRNALRLDWERAPKVLGEMNKLNSGGITSENSGWPRSSSASPVKPTWPALRNKFYPRSPTTLATYSLFSQQSSSDTRYATARGSSLGSYSNPFLSSTFASKSGTPPPVSLNSSLSSFDSLCINDDLLSNPAGDLENHKAENSWEMARLTLQAKRALFLQAQEELEEATKNEMEMFKLYASKRGSQEG